MQDIKFKTLQQCAIQNVMARNSESAEKAMARVEPFNNLHIAAFMDIEKTTDSLQHILEYKKEVANRMLQTSDENELELLAEALKHAESLIKKVLGLTPEQAQTELLGLLPTHKESVEACDNSKFDKTSKDKDSWNSGKVAGWNECYFWILNLLKEK